VIDSFWTFQRVDGLISSQAFILFKHYFSLHFGSSFTNAKVGITSVRSDLRRCYQAMFPMLYSVYDLCYFVNLLTLTYIWIFPSSKILFIVCYMLSHGPVALAIVLWKNSLVFHSECVAAHEFSRSLTSSLVSGLDKVTSLFIHMYSRRTPLHSRRIRLPFQVSSTDLVHHSLAPTIRPAT
jgi:hypothetical protein